MAIKREDKYITDVSQEINLGESIGWTAKVLKAFPAFNHKNYRLFFSGQLISLVGTWLQIVALGWLVLELTNSAFWVGTISALSLLPV
ncbi:MAG: MFS transporter, partial [Patescibacteria group bacterium]